MVAFSNQSTSKSNFPYFQYVNIVPLILVLLLSVVLVYSWLSIRSENQERLKLEVDGHLLHFSTQLKEHFNSRFAIAKLLQRKWSQNLINDQQSFSQEALEFHAIYLDFQAISWVNTDRIITWVNPEKPNAKAKGLDLSKLELPNKTINEAIKQNSLQTTPPLILAQGGKGFVGYLPLYLETELQGYLNLVFKAKPAIEDAVHEKFHDRFILNVYDQDVSLIPVVEYPKDSTFLNKTFVKIGSRQWTVEISPTQQEDQMRYLRLCCKLVVRLKHV